MANNDFKNSIEWQQFEVLVKNTRAGFLFGALFIVFFYVTIPSTYPKSGYLVWALVYLLIFSYKLVLVNKIDRIEQNILNIHVYQRLFDIGQLLSGLCFSYLFIFLNPNWPVVNQIVFWVLMISFSTGSITLYSIRLISYLLLAMPPVIAGIFTILTIYSETAALFATILCVIGISAVISAYRSNRLFNQLCISQKLLSDTNKKLESIASKDPLTRLPNRRAYDEYFMSEWDRHKRSASIMSLLIIDVDHFKEYNDHYGHSEGDTCLIRLANIINTNLKRPGDLASRYGGEEFVVILPDTGYRGALEVAERIRNTIHELKIPHEYSEISPFVTVSVGVSSIDPSEENDPQAFFDQADRQLYNAKQSGRNKVCIDTESILKPEIIEPT